MSFPSYTYHGSPGEMVPKDVEQVIIDLNAKIIRSKAFSGCASLAFLVIPTSITIIEDHAFEQCTSLEGLEIPESITTIGDGAFLQCKALKCVEIPKSITSISAYTFHGCESLETVSILGPVTSIGRNAFYRCTSMDSITLPTSVATIAELAFSECFSLKSMEIPACVDEIAWGTFQRCFALTTIKLSESVTTIAWGAFAECFSLASLELPSPLLTIGDYAFDGCTSLTFIVVPNQVTRIGISAFAGCTSLQSVAIPPNMTIIDQRVFEGCTSLISVTIPESVTTIGESAFEECKSLTSVACPSSIRRIGSRAFKGCKCLLSIVIPESIESIGDRAFSECRQLENGAEDGASDVTLWLRFRFNRRPAHQVCYRPDVTKDKISAYLADQPGLAKDLDSLGLSAFHVLLMNERAEPDMVNEFLSAYPDAASAIGPLSRFPLHFAAMNTNLPLSVFKLLSHSFTKDERLVLTVQDETKSLPCSLAIRCKRLDDIVMHLFERYPIKKSNLKTTEEFARLESIRDQYISGLSKKSEASIQAFDPLQRHGWVSYVIGVQDKTDAAKQCVRFIEEADIQVVRILAYFKDLHGRLAIQSATNEIRQAMERRILVFGRFELQRGPPISKSPVSCVLRVIDRRASDEYRNSFEMALACESNAGQNRSIGEEGFRTFLNRLGVDFDGTGFRDMFAQWKSDPNMRMSEEQCIVLCTNVLDTGQPQEVALKFMTDTVRFRREIDLRDKLRLDSGYVVFVNNHFSYDTHDESFASALNVIRDEGGIECKDYKHAIVMPLADSNLDTIFRNERPQPNEIRSLAKQLAEAIAYVHSKGLIHGCLTTRNVVRIGGRLRLIDFCAAVELGSYVGATFSSGVLPPEMIAKLTVDECRRFDKYFSELKFADPIGWAKIDPKVVDESSFYAVKTFLSREAAISDEHEEADGDNTVTEYPKFEPLLDSTLPYKLVHASVSIDVWAFGGILYALHTGSSLFDVNRDNDLASGEAMKELYEWNESKKLVKLKKVRDPLAHRLLRIVLSRDPAERYESIECVLVDDYFVTRWLPELSDEHNKKAEEAIRKVTIELRSTKREIMQSIGNSASVTLTSFFDAAEVKSPVCFIILPYESSPWPMEGSPPSIPSSSNSLDQAFGYIAFVLGTILKCMRYPDPAAFTAEYIKGPYVAPIMYLYLVDESTGESVRVDNVYPLDIDLKCEQVQTFLPLMAMGIRALAATKAAIGVMNMFLPGIPKDQIPRNVWAKVENFVLESNKVGFSHPSFMDDASVTSDGRASEFREFIGFLTENDAASTLSGMRRICDKTSEQGMWVTEENAQAMEDGNEIAWRGSTEQVADGCCSIS
jgi:serine/threonine protein kinase